MWKNQPSRDSLGKSFCWETLGLPSVWMFLRYVPPNVWHAGQIRLVHGGPTSEFTRLLLCWCQMPQHTFRSPLGSIVEQARDILAAKVRPTHYKAGGHNVMPDQNIVLTVVKKNPKYLMSSIWSKDPTTSTYQWSIFSQSLLLSCKLN